VSHAFLTAYLPGGRSHPFPFRIRLRAIVRLRSEYENRIDYRAADGAGQIKSDEALLRAGRMEDFLTTLRAEKAELNSAA
jgi:hypothetical protein